MEQVPDFVSASFHDPSKEGMRTGGTTQKLPLCMHCVYVYVYVSVNDGMYGGTGAWLEGALDQAHNSGNFMLQKQAGKIGSPEMQGRSQEFGNGSGQGWLDRCVAAWRPAGQDGGRKVLSPPSWRENREEASSGNTQDIALLSHQSPTLANNLAADPVRKGGGGFWGFGPTFRMPALPQMQFPSFVMNTQGEEKREQKKTVTGIGCTLERRCSTGEIFVVAVKPGGGCANAGVEVGSKVETIDEIPVRGRPIKVLKKLCLGPAGTHMMLGIVRPLDIGGISINMYQWDPPPPPPPQTHNLSPVGAMQL